MLSTIVSQCQTCMRGFNPTSQRGSEEEPLSNHSLNSPLPSLPPPPSPGEHSAHVVPQHVNGGSRPTDRTHSRHRRKTDSWQKWRAWPGALSARWLGVQTEWYWSKCLGCHPLSGSELHTTVSYWIDESLTMKQRQCLILPETLALYLDVHFALTDCGLIHIISAQSW